MHPRKVLIGGQFVSSGEAFEVFDPSNGELIGETYSGTRTDVDLALKEASDGLDKLKSLPAFVLRDGLRAISKGIEKRSEDFASSIVTESAKPLKYARGEVERAVETFRLAAEQVIDFKGEQINTELSAAAVETEGYTRYEPRGIVVGICPFNFPLNLVAHKVAPALASRNPIIVKPSEKTPLTALLLAEVFLESGLPENLLQVIPFSLENLHFLLQDERVATISFTGSDKVGWSLNEHYPRKKVLLELGGNAPVIVDEGTDLERAASRIAFGGFAYSGQVCISVQRVIADKSVFDELLDNLLDEVKSLKKGAPSSESTDIAEMITVEAAEKVERKVSEAVSAGAVLHCGGNRSGNFFEPTVLSNVNPHSEIYNEEIFGPIVLIEVSDGFAESIEIANATRFGLQAGVFTDKLSNADQAVENLEFGSVIINDVPTFRVDNMPYGGIKDSGNTKEGVKYAMREMSHQKLIVKRKIG